MQTCLFLVIRFSCLFVVVWRISNSIGPIQTLLFIDSFGKHYLRLIFFAFIPFNIAFNEKWFESWRWNEMGLCLIYVKRGTMAKYQLVHWSKLTCDKFFQFTHPNRFYKRRDNRRLCFCSYMRFFTKMTSPLKSINGID